jgi:hypothetical protein
MWLPHDGQCSNLIFSKSSSLATFAASFHTLYKFFKLFMALPHFALAPLPLAILAVWLYPERYPL